MVALVSKAYNIQIVEGTLYPPYEEPEQWTDKSMRRPWPIDSIDSDVSNNRHRTSPTMPEQRARPLLQCSTPPYWESLLTRFLRSKPIPDCA